MSKIEVNTVAPQCGTTLTLGESGDTVQLGTGASQSGFGRTGAVDWQTGSVKTATFTAANGEGYFADTSGSAFNMNLPAGTAGAIVAVADYSGTFNSNNLTIVPNGSDKIAGVSGNAKLTVAGQSVVLVFVDSTKGWITTQDSSENISGATFIAATGGTVTTVCTDFKVHTFTGPGTFCVSSVGNASGSNTVSYLVVGGGGGAGYNRSGGGGAGGFRESRASTCSYTASPLNATSGPTFNLPVTATGFPITVGGGGAAGTGTPFPTGPGANGNNSVFSTITAAGGGGGGCANSDPYPVKGGRDGGSGGGAGTCSGATQPRPAGTGNTPPVTPPQGQNGGASPGNPGVCAGAGGGGAGAVGTDISVNRQGAPGGNGVSTQINPAQGSPATNFAGGGGGGGHPSGPATLSTGGTGGGAGGSNGPSPHPAGVANTGGGGGGTGPSSSPQAATAGGSGIVIIRYKFQ